MSELNLYEQTIKKEVDTWKHEMQKPPNVISKMTKSFQSKVQQIVPRKVQEFISKSVKKMTEAIVLGSSLVTDTENAGNLSLAESDFLVEKAFATYNKAAIVQGVGCGAGGILLGLADFPALLTIKMKFLFDCAKLYGCDVNDKSEREFMLYIFQLAFCSDQRRLEVFPVILNWEQEVHTDRDQIDWEKFQTEYRDYIDLAKLLQLLPVVGAVAGGVANHSLLEKLKVTAMNCYRLRFLQRRR